MWCSPSQMGGARYGIYLFIYLSLLLLICYRDLWVFLGFNPSVSFLYFCPSLEGASAMWYLSDVGYSICCTDSHLYVRSAVTHRLGDDPSCDMEALRGGPHGQYLRHLHCSVISTTLGLVSLMTHFSHDHFWWLIFHLEALFLFSTIHWWLVDHLGTLILH